MHRTRSVCTLPVPLKLFLKRGPGIGKGATLRAAPIGWRRPRAPDPRGRSATHRFSQYSLQAVYSV